MQITALACGPGGHHLVRGLLDALDLADPGAGDTSTSLTVVAGTSHDITLCGLRLCPDLDALATVLAPAHPRDADPRRRDATYAVYERLRSRDAAPEWYRIDDVTFADAIARSRWLGAGLTLSEVCERLVGPTRARLLPMSDSPIESHVVLEDGDSRRAVHALEWAATADAGAPVGITAAGLSTAHPAPGVLDSIRSAGAVILPLTAPVTGLGVMLGLPGLRDALRGTTAPVIGVSPTLLPASGREEATLATLDLDYTSTDVAGLFADVLDGYLVPEAEVESLTSAIRRSQVTVAPAPSEATGLAREACDLARRLAQPVR